MLIDKTKEGKDPLYRTICDSSNSVIQRLEELWSIFKPYADKGFEQLFRDDVVSHFWEMYLGALLILEKKELCKKKDDYGPDICVIENDEEKIWLEARATGKGEGNDKVEIKKSGWSPDEDIILRIRSAIEDKHQQYLKYLKKGLIKESEPYIIAINASKIGFPDSIGTPKILESLFGIGRPYVTIEANKIVEQGFHAREKILKKSGSPVETDIFLKKKYAGISAIIYSKISPFNYTDHLGFDIELVHNPNATNPIKRGWLMAGIEYYIESESLKWTNWDLAKKD